MKIPIVMITGYLGAGKTTLLRRIIDGADRKLAVLMNEFGEIGIDTKVVKGKNVDIKELAGGCVCCSMTGEFEAAIKEIREKIKPELIVIETTGVAEPDAIVGDILENLEGVRLDSVVAVADADALARFPSIGHTGRVQLEMADVIILNKIDLVSGNQKGEVKEKLYGLNRTAVLLEAVRCDVGLDFLLDIRTPRKRAEPHEHDHLEEEKIQSFVFSAEKRLDKDRLEVLVSSLPSDIIRAKGFASTNKGGFFVNMAFGRCEFEVFPAGKTELVFIGKAASQHRNSVLKELEACETG